MPHVNFGLPEAFNRIVKYTKSYRQNDLEMMVVSMKGIVKMLQTGGYVAAVKDLEPYIASMESAIQARIRSGLEAELEGATKQVMDISETTPADEVQNRLHKMRSVICRYVSHHKWFEEDNAADSKTVPFDDDNGDKEADDYDRNSDEYKWP